MTEIELAAIAGINRIPSSRNFLKDWEMVIVRAILRSPHADKLDFADRYGRLIYDEDRWRAEYENEARK